MNNYIITIQKSLHVKRFILKEATSKELEILIQRYTNQGYDVKAKKESN